MSYELLILLHISSVVIMLGVGGGSAFYKFMADRSKNLEVIVHTNTIVVFADWIFTTPSVIALPITGLLLMSKTGYTLDDNWLFISLILYIFSAVLWLIAVYLQMKMKDMAIKAQKEGDTLGDEYYVLVKQWIFLGIFSFLAVGVIFVLMGLKI